MLLNIQLKDISQNSSATNRGDGMDFSTMAGLVSRELQKNEGSLDIALTTKMIQQIDLWSKMYRNESSWTNEKTKSCNLASAISGEIARLVTLEHESEVNGSIRADFINEQYKQILPKLRQYVEYGCAKGGLIIKPYVSGDKINIQFIQADGFLPISFDGSGNVTDCAFIEQIKRGNKIYTRLERHQLKGTLLKISNRAFVATNAYTLGSEIPVSSIQEWSDLMYEVAFSDVDKVPFGYFKVPLANSIDTGSPLGVSVYGKAVELIKEADVRYSQISWEYEAKEAAVHIGESMLKDDPVRKGRKLAPEHKDRLYRALEFNSGASDKPFLDTFSPDIRHESLFKGFNAQLRLIEFNCNLAYGTLSDLQEVDKTAEEIKTSKQRSYTMVTDTQMALQKALEDTITAIDFYCTIYSLCPKGTYDVSFTWDDSIIVDSETERKNDREEVAMGVMSLAEYRAKWYGETIEEAEKKLPEQSETMQ